MCKRLNTTPTPLTFPIPVFNCCPSTFLDPHRLWKSTGDSSWSKAWKDHCRAGYPADEFGSTYTISGLQGWDIGCFLLYIGYGYREYQGTKDMMGWIFPWCCQEPLGAQPSIGKLLYLRSHNRWKIPQDRADSQNTCSYGSDGRSLVTRICLNVQFVNRKESNFSTSSGFDLRGLTCFWQADHALPSLCGRT